jgi:hypothetical protein
MLFFVFKKKIIDYYILKSQNILIFQDILTK